MRKIRFILLIALALFQSCKSEAPKTNNKKSNQLEQIENFCFISNIKQKDEETSIALDFIEYKKFSNLDSAITLSQVIELPNGFCYVNEKIELRNFKISKNAKIIMQTFSHKEDGSFNFNQKISLAEFTEFSETSKFRMLKLSPFKVIIEGEKIILLEEIYLP